MKRRTRDAAAVGGVILLAFSFFFELSFISSKRENDNSIRLDLIACPFSPRDVARCRWEAYIRRTSERSNGSKISSKTLSPSCKEPFTVARPLKPRFPPKSSSQRRAAICAVHANGERYLDEWTDYHLALGFQHIYIYDNSPTFTLQEWALLKQTEEKGSVQVFHGPGSVMQRALYARCLKQIREQHGSNITWMATIDIDEFIVLREHSNVIDFLETYLNVGETQVGSLAFNWEMMYGTAFGYEALPMLRRCQQRSPGNRANTHIKPISKVDSVVSPDIHYDNLKNGLLMKDTAGHMFLPRPFNPQGEMTKKVAVVYHCHSISLEEFFTKACVTGRADASGNPRCKEYTFQLHQDRLQSFNTTDDSAWKSLTHLLPEYKEFDLLP